MCSVRALKSVRLKAMFSWLAVRFSRDLGDLAICLGHSSSLSGRGSSTSEFLSSVHGVYRSHGADGARELAVCVWSDI